MEYLTVIISSFISIIILFVLCKLMGRKQISQLNFFDYVIGITIGSIASIVAVSDNYKILAYGIISMVFFGIIDLIISHFVLKSFKLRKTVIGEPVIIIDNHQFNYENMKKQRLDVNSLLSEARINGYFDISKIKYAFMEINGRISFLPDNEVYTYDLIIDGKFNHNNLNLLNINPEDLINQFGDYLNILLLIIDENKKYTVFKKT